MSNVTIYHNPDCGTSRKTLGPIATPVLSLYHRKNHALC